MQYTLQKIVSENKEKKNQGKNIAKKDKQK